MLNSGRNQPIDSAHGYDICGYYVMDGGTVTYRIAAVLPQENLIYSNRPIYRVE